MKNEINFVIIKFHSRFLFQLYRNDSINFVIIDNKLISSIIVSTNRS